MRIALISLIHSVGGAERYSLNLATAISKLDHSITLYVNSEKTTTEIITDNLTIKKICSKEIFIDPGNPISGALIKTLLKEKNDIFHVHQMNTFFNLISSSVGRLKGVPVVLTDHGGGWRLAAIPYIPANFPTSFAAVSKFSLNHILRFAPTKRDFSRVVYGGVDTSIFYPKTQNYELKKRLGLQNNRILLCLGRLFAHKGFDVAIKSLSLLPSDVRLLVVGQVIDNKYLFYLKSLVDKYCKGRVLFIGEVNDQKLPEYYNLCDIFIQPSVYFDYLGNYRRLPELLGLSRLEAMACEKPVIVSRVGGLPEKIQHGINGYIFEQRDYKELATYLKILLSDVVLRRKIARNGLLTVQKELTWEKIAKNNLKLYEKLTN